MSVLNGSCLCGAVRYELDDELLYAGYCHCSDCRKFSGAASSAFAGAKAHALRITAGENVLGVYEKTPDTVLHFCSQCGSSLFARKPNKGRVHVRMGSLDDSPSLRPQLHVYVASKASWETMGEDGLPCFDTIPGEAS